MGHLGPPTVVWPSLKKAGDCTPKFSIQNRRIGATKFKATSYTLHQGPAVLEELSGPVMDCTHPQSSFLASA